MTRTPLPNRRQLVTDKIALHLRPDANPAKWLISVGPVPGPIQEIFIKGPRGDVSVLLEDAMILASLLMQSDHAIEYVAKRTVREADGRPASLIGLVLDHAVKMEKDIGPC